MTNAHETDRSFDRVYSMIHPILERQFSMAVLPHHALMTDLNADGLDIVEIVMSVEETLIETYGVDLHLDEAYFDDLPDLTVSDLVKWATAGLPKSPPQSPPDAILNMTNVLATTFPEWTPPSPLPDITSMVVQLASDGLHWTCTVTQHNGAIHVGNAVGSDRTDIVDAIVNALMNIQ